MLFTDETRDEKVTFNCNVTSDPSDLANITWSPDGREIKVFTEYCDFAFCNISHLALYLLYIHIAGMNAPLRAELLFV